MNFKNVVPASLLILFSALLLTACPQNNKGDKTQDPVGIRPGAEAPPTQAGGEQPGGSTPDETAGGGAATSDGAAAEADNPKPTGDQWVWASKRHYRIGEQMDVEFHSNAGEKAWIGLIPSDISAEDAASNDAADVSYQYLPADTNMVKLNAPQTGEYVLKLISGSEATDKVLYTSPAITVTQWEKGDLATQKAPYITLGQQTKPGAIELPTGAPLWVYWTLPEEYADSAWIAMVPADTAATDDGANDAVDVDYQYIKAGTQGHLSFFLKEPGKYVFRLFPNTEPATEMVAESEPFTVVPAPPAK